MCHVLQMATSGKGSWELQRHIEGLTWKGKYHLHKILTPYYWHLSAHPNGNYIVSQMCESKVCLPELLSLFKLSLSKVCDDFYSCRVLQTLIKVCSVKDILVLSVSLTDLEIYDLCTRRHGSWSISALYIKTLSSKIREVVFTFAPTLSTHNCGMKVVGNVFKFTAMHGLSIERGVNSLISSRRALSLSTHMFGHSFVRICLEMANPEQRVKLFNILSDKVVPLAFNRFGSIVAEKIVAHACQSEVERMGVIIVDNVALMHAFTMSFCAKYVLSLLLSRSSGPMLFKGILYLRDMQQRSTKEAVEADHALNLLSKLQRM